MRRHGDILTLPDRAPARCYPSTALAACDNCARRSFAAPERHRVSIDGTVVLRRGVCELQIPVYDLCRVAAGVRA